MIQHFVQRLVQHAIQLLLLSLLRARHHLADLVHALLLQRVLHLRRAVASLFLHLLLNALLLVCRATSRIERIRRENGDVMDRLLAHQRRLAGHNADGNLDVLLFDGRFVRKLGDHSLVARRRHTVSVKDRKRNGSLVELRNEVLKVHDRLHHLLSVLLNRHVAVALDRVQLDQQRRQSLIQRGALVLVRIVLRANRREVVFLQSERLPLVEACSKKKLLLLERHSRASLPPSSAAFCTPSPSSTPLPSLPQWKQAPCFARHRSHPSSFHSFYSNPHEWKNGIVMSSPSSFPAPCHAHRTLYRNNVKTGGKDDYGSFSLQFSIQLALTKRNGSDRERRTVKKEEG